MATRELLWIGIDTGKDELVIDDGRRTITVSNTSAAIRQWLKQLPGPARIGVEATGTYHLQVLELASEKGHQPYVIDGFRLNRYRDVVGDRAKTDLTDARLVRRYLRNEFDELRPWQAPPVAYTRLKSLLRRRAKIVQARTALRQSLAGVPELRAVSRGLLEGIGPLVAAAFATSYLRGEFRSSDAFVAFLGLDVRVRDSGKRVGQRRLSKKGDGEMRRLAYIAAMAASRSGRWKEQHLANQARGLSRIQSLVIIARKLVRLAFALLKSGEEYRPQLPQGATATT